MYRCGPRTRLVENQNWRVGIAADQQVVADVVKAVSVLDTLDHGLLIAGQHYLPVRNNSCDDGPNCIVICSTLGDIQKGSDHDTIQHGFQ